MKSVRRVLLGFIGASTTVATPSFGAVLPFTYQGQLKQGGAPIQGLVDLQVGLWNKPSDGDELEVVGFKAVEVVNGLFTVDLVFDPRFFNGDPLFLEISVRSPHDPTDGAPFETLAPRQPILPAPYALHSFQGASRNALDASDGSPTNAVFVDADGDVGVGTTAPAADLHVRGKTPTGRLTLTPSVADSSAEILMTENTSATLGAFMRYDGASNQWQVLGLARDELNNPVTNGPHLVVGRDNGRVGIGTAAPAEPFHVAGDARFDGPNGIGVRNPDNLGAAVRLSWLNDVPRIRWGGSGVGAANGFDFQRIGDVSLLRIQEDGRIGIGTATPAARLHVAPSLAGVAPYPPATTIVESSSDTRVAILCPTGNESGLYFGTPSNPLAAGVIFNAVTAGSISLAIGSPSAGLVIDNNSNVAIGSNPISTAKFLVAGNTRLNGSVTINGDLDVTGSISMDPVTGFATVQPGEFWGSQNLNVLTHSLHHAAIFAGSPASGDAPVHLPHGAVITALQLVADDTGDNRNATLRLGRLPMDGSSFENFAEVSTTGSAGHQRRTTTTITRPNVDNGNYFYYVSIEWLKPDNGEIVIYGARITYTVSSLQGGG